MTRRPPRSARRPEDLARHMLVRATAATALLLLAGCASAPAPAEPRPSSPAAEPSKTTAMTLLPGMPPPIDPADVYAADRPGNLAAAAAHARPLVYVPNFGSDTLSVIDPRTYKVVRTVPAGHGPQHVVPSWDLRTLWINDNTGNTLIRDSRYLYVANRGAGSVSVLDFRTDRLVSRWQLPGHASPDMGGVSADGRVLWLSGRYDHEVYAIDTATGHLIARIPVGTEPHGLCVWPQPGRYSLGHTGILR